MQRAEAMVGMTWIFRILPRSVWVYFKIEARWFPSCAHVLIPSNKLPDTKTTNDKLDLLDEKMERLQTQLTDTKTTDDKIDLLDKKMDRLQTLLQELSSREQRQGRTTSIVTEI